MLKENSEKSFGMSKENISAFRSILWNAERKSFGTPEENLSAFQLILWNTERIFLFELTVHLMKF
jgi:hypothetical protein